MTSDGKQRVAVLGGGLAGLTTAYELSASGKFDVTVYQMGWRLGGKVASSRNDDVGLRIEEHGIHVLFGAYENAFHVLRRVYGDLGRNWKDAFVERSEFTLMEEVGQDWKPWILGMARQPGDPGDALAGKTAQASSVPYLVTDLVQWLRDHVLGYFKGTLLERPTRWFFGSTIGRMHRSANDLRGKQDQKKERRADARRLLLHLRWNLFLIRVVGWIGHVLWMVLRPFLRDALEKIDNVRRLWIGAELAVATAAGLTKAALQGRKFEDLDNVDLRDWLRRNGVIGGKISRTSATSACLRMVYEVIFAYERGDPKRPRVAAGTAVRGLLRLLFDRRGALAYAMRAGSAETLITPLYEALQKRGVRFEFFHRIDRLDLSPDGRYVDEVRFTRQATPKEAYDPLIDGGAWPDRPKYDLLVDGESLAARERDDGGRDLETPTFTPAGASHGSLRRGRGGEDGDFDLVVLAIPVAALKTICDPLAAHDPVWQTMLEQTHTTATQSVQLWFDRTAQELGWDPKGATEPALLGTYVQPFGNWMDLSMTIAREGWKARGLPVPKSVAYLCGPLDEAIQLGPARDAKMAHVRDACRSWLAKYAPRLWPKAFLTGGLDGSRLVAPPQYPAAARYDVQFFRANTNPAERYTLTLPGTTRSRLLPDDSGFANLYLAGDWTANGFDVGCVEAAVMSGRLAARAVLGLSSDQMYVYAEREHHRHHVRAIEFRRPDVFEPPAPDEPPAVSVTTRG
jgi:uncharacterized protein with NAD-binding domain and iron-sulfur cluster